MALLAALCTHSQAAAAPPEPELGVSLQELPGGQPAGFLDLRLRPREVGRGRLTVKNTGPKAARVALYAVDAETAANLGFAYKVRRSGRHGSTRWTRLSAQRALIAPGQSLDFDVAVAVPRKAKPGDYLSAVGVEALNQSGAPAKSNLQIATRRRHAVGVLVRVPGPRKPRIRFTGAYVRREPAGVTFFLKAANTGNALLTKVRGVATITRDGVPVASQQIGPGTFVAKTAIRYPVLAKQERPKADTEYRVRARVRYRGGVARLDTRVRFGEKEEKKQAEFLGTPSPDEEKGLPWWVWLIGPALVAGLAFYAYRRQRRGRPLTPAQASSALARELEAATDARPVSVLVIPTAATGRKSRRALLAGIRSRLRSTDLLARHGESGYLVISKDTGVEAVGGLAADLHRTLSRVDGFANGDAPKIGAATTERQVPPEQLVGQAAAGPGV